MAVWLIALGVIVLLYASGLALLYAVGRKSDAVSWACFIPDCLVLLKGLVGDPRVGRGYKAMLVALIAYLAMPFDLVPDFLPVIGLLDDVIIVVLVLRVVLRAVPAEVVTEKWRGDAPGLARVMSVAAPPA